MWARARCMLMVRERVLFVQGTSGKCLQIFRLFWIGPRRLLVKVNEWSGYALEDLFNTSWRLGCIKGEKHKVCQLRSSQVWEQGERRNIRGFFADFGGKNRQKMPQQFRTFQPRTTDFPTEANSYTFGGGGWLSSIHPRVEAHNLSMVWSVHRSTVNSVNA